MPNHRFRPRFVGRRTVDQTPAAYRAATHDMLAYSEAARRIEDHLKGPAEVRRALELIDALAARRRITLAEAAALVTAEVLSRPAGTRTADR